MKEHCSYGRMTAQGFQTFEFDFDVPRPSDKQCECFVEHKCRTCLYHGWHDCEHPEYSPDGVCEIWGASIDALQEGEVNYLRAIQAIHSGGESHE